MTNAAESLPMDEDRFDLVAKRLADLSSRRGLLGALAGGLIAAVAGLGAPVPRLMLARQNGTVGTADPLGSALIDYWRRAGGERSWLGKPVSDLQTVADGEALYFERGALWRGPVSEGAVVASTLHPPLMGCPDLCTTDGVVIEQMIRWGARQEFPIAGWLLARVQHERPGLFSEIWEGRLGVRPVLRPGEATEILSLAISAPVTQPGGSSDRPYVAQDAQLPTGVAFRNRTLYDIVSSTGALVSPSSLYAQDDWSNFAFIHATDVHVSKRTDLFRDVLLQSPDPDVRAGADEFINYNDGLRDLIRYANTLHDRGMLDFIVMTGDLVDYIFEDPYLFNPPYDHPDLAPYADRSGGGNFQFLQEILLGEARPPEEDDRQEAWKDWPPYEKLRAPIFTTLGNHDYRVGPYLLRFQLEVDVPWVPDPLLNIVMDTFQNLSVFDPHNLTADEANWLQLRDLSTKTHFASSGTTLLIEEGSVRAYYNPTAEPPYLQLMLVNDDSDRRRLIDQLFVERDAQPNDYFEKQINFDYYEQRLNPGTSYVKALGQHRLVMLNTLWDAGLPSSRPDSASAANSYLTRASLGWISADAERIVDASPNQIGIDCSALRLLEETLRGTADDGAVIVGMHGPVINASGSEYPHYFRETEHPTANPQEMLGYLKRRKPEAFVGPGVPSTGPVGDVPTTPSTGGTGEVPTTPSTGGTGEVPTSPSIGGTGEVPTAPSTGIGGVETDDPDPATVLTDWPRDGTRYFKRGQITELLDDGASRCYCQAEEDSQAHRFLELCNGTEQTRPVDLVLYGHVHRNVEYRVKPSGDEFQFYQDFYTGFPHGTRYYASKKITDSLDGPPRAGARDVEIRVTQFPQDGIVETSQGREFLRVTAYASPLSAARGQAATKAWWSRHRPLLIQTASLGPIDFAQREQPNPNPAFQGFRVVTVHDAGIDKIHYVTMEQLRRFNFQLEWEEEAFNAKIEAVCQDKTCPTDQICCMHFGYYGDPICVDLLTAHFNCGKCGDSCDNFETCRDGECQCISSEINARPERCAMGCRDLLNDRWNCGACDNPCPGVSNCVVGQCACVASAFNDNPTECHDVCVDIDNDRWNCGGCDVHCGGLMICKEGHCVCEPWEHNARPEMCNDDCVDLANDRRNCGQCGNICGDTQCLHSLCG